MLQAKPRAGLSLVVWVWRQSLTLALGASVLLCACDDKQNPGDTQPSGTHSNTGKNSDDSYALETTLTLGSNQLSPGEVTDVLIQIEPPGSHDVKIAISSGGELAFLSDSILITDSTGRAQTKLTVARTGVGQVTLQALVDGAAPEYETASVVPPDEATLNVVPVYTGDRPFTEWHVAILDSPDCPTDHETYVHQDTHTFMRPAAGEPLFLNSVPAGRPLSVLVRAFEYAFGCVPGVIVTNDTSQVVEVDVTDEPMIVDDLAFAMHFGVYVNSEPFWGNLSTYLATIGNTFRGEFEADSVALLSKMEQLASSPEAFAQSRQDKTWDTLLELRLSSAGASQGLTSRVQRWLLDGAQLLQSNTALLAQVEAMNTTQAAVELTTVAGLAPDEVGIAKPKVEATLKTSGTDDFLRLAFTLDFEPSRLFGALASRVVATAEPLVRCEAPVKGPLAEGDASVPDAGMVDSGAEAVLDAGAAVSDAATSDAALSDAGPTDPASALAASIGCETVGLWLSENTGFAYEGCDATCAARLCEDAIAELWQQVLDADTAKRTLQVSAAGRAALDERGHVVGLTAGEWIGTTDLFMKETDPKGTLQGCTGSR